MSALFSKRSFLPAVFLALLAVTAAAQSSDQNFPTPLTTNEIDGMIKARDMGDPRATVYFYAFEGGQGDIFINVVTKNFSGDIDIFTVDAMSPLTKMVIYADGGTSETGRLIYLRKPERLLLRVEGRTPNDDPATFRIKFGGSFIALAPQEEEEAPTVARNDPNEPGIKVDSVGRIVAIVPKPQPTPKVVEPKQEPPASAGGTTVKPPTIAKTTTKPAVPGRNATVKERAPAKPNKPVDPGTVYENETAKVIVAPEPKVELPASAGGKTATPKPSPAKKTNTASKKPEPKKADETTTAGDTQAGSPRSDAHPADALAAIRLVIQMKDGTVFWLPMNKVAKFIVNKGTMTVTAKDGSVTRYNILNVEKTTIQ